MSFILELGKLAGWASHTAVRRMLRLFMAASLGLVPWISQAALTQPIWQEPGVAYFRDANPRIPLAVHVVRIDRSQKDLEFHTTLGGDNQIGMAVLSQQAKFIKPQIGKAVAAINGDYFYTERPFMGDPMNLQILRGGELVSGPGADRAFFYLDAQGEPHVTNAVDAFLATWPNGKSIPIGLNETPATVNQPVLYTTIAGVSTRIEGVDLILERGGNSPWLPLRVGQKLTAKIRRVNKQGYSRIDPDCMVLSLNPRTVKQLPPLTPGMEIKISTATIPDLSGAILAIGGGPSLVRGGKAREPREFPGFQMRHPRSAMGWNDKYYYFVQADGRQPRYSMGMTLLELANYFVQLGCDYAINLDGGGSCTTWIAGSTVNSPSQGRERPSANALVLVPKNKTSN
jgi:large repetitive protein